MGDVLVTGATGFVGRGLVSALLKDKYSVIAATRSEVKDFPDGLAQLPVGEITPDNNWKDALKTVSHIVHLAARAHIRNDDTTDPLAEYRKINRDSTLELARQAAESGVERFVFISSIGVNGNSNLRPFTEMDEPNPAESYAISKLEAEEGLKKLGKDTGMEIVIIRPPLVYGPDAPGNFGSLVKWVQRGIPLPFGAVKNARSFVALDNLANFIIHCMRHPKAANEIFLISDGEDVTTADLISKVAGALKKRQILLPVPVIAMQTVAVLLGKKDVANRLFGSLRVDSSKARNLLGWKPVVTMEQELEKLNLQ